MKFQPWWTSMLLFLTTRSCVCEEKCLKQDMAIPRHFYVNEHELPFRIQISMRETHQLVSHIFKILLTEVVGYKDVRLIQSNLTMENITSVMQKITNCDGHLNCTKVGAEGPEIMINLEVWLSPGFNMKDWTSTGELEDCGPLGPVGRSAWFVPEYAVQKLWLNKSIVLDHWKAFRNPSVVSMFDLIEYNLNNYTYNLCTNSPYCTFDECDERGLFRPIQCQNVSCATLLSDYPESTFSLLTKQITDLKLLVNVAWVGSNLETIVNERTVAGNNTVFFHKQPSTLATLGNVVHVSFPQCDDNENPACAYQIYQLEKITWSKVKSHAVHAFDLLKAMTFSQDEYVQLLDKYSREKLRGFMHDYVACRWVDENRYLWDKWIPSGLNEKTSLYIGGIFPMSGPYWKQDGIATAAEMAVKAVNGKSNVLPNYKLNLLVQDGHCVPDEVMKSFINYVTNDTYKSMVGVLGPACTDTVEPIAGLAKHFNTTIISYSAEGSLFSNRDKYPYFFRTIPENNQFRFVYLKLFQSLKWSRVAALTEDGQKYPEYVSHLQDLFQSNGMTFIANRKFPRERNSLDMKPYLQDLKDKKARIIIGDFYDYAARAVMCAAYRLEMTSAHGYQWFLPLWFSSNWFDTDHHNKIASAPKERVSCTTKEMIEAINGHLSLAYKFYADPDLIMQEDKTVKQWIELYRKQSDKENRQFSQYGGYAYDAVWVFAYALDALFKENNSHVATLHTVKTSKRLVEHLNETTFNGVSGYVKSIGSGRLSKVEIWQWWNNSKHRVGTYKPLSYVDGELELNESRIKWLTANGQKPSDGSIDEETCGLEYLRKVFGISCEMAVGMVTIIVFSIILILMLIGVMVFKRRYDKRMRKTEARMKELGLMDNLGVVDEWEMRRDHIVINRKLGQGEFGTVYGGEAFNKSSEWIAVAVKTLKVGAKTDEKLDFLSEAEVMKKLNHMNIVHLIGVCTMGEPVYTVMEFMLYGDLKTYLLGRRNLVTEPDRVSNDEVSDKRLTNMALDIARGLSYLADLKFVHRDLASRNCLVNANRLVKIADFGMCRSMFDSDYYRYTKRGKLPIRWMAPESLRDGLFTSMCDVWSYGVVLYEIITFGSFPYQGMSNNQVIHHLKEFNTLEVPEGCKLELESLLKSCWSKNPDNRPLAAEIVEVLANNPELISPCLDMPIASVEVEDSESLEVGIHDRSRLHSLSSLWHSRRHFEARNDSKETNLPPASPKDETPPVTIELRPYVASNGRTPTTHYVIGRKSVPKDHKMASCAWDSTQCTKL